MKKIYIPTTSSIPIWRQIKDQNSFVVNGYQYVFDANQEYDYIVVLDSLSFPIETKCPKENRFLFLGEPPYVKHYPDAYLKQFGNIYTCQPGIVKKYDAKLSMSVLPWMIGCDLKNGSHECLNQECMTYSDFENFDITDRNRLDKACLITSNKTFTVGHRERVKFANQVLKEKLDFIDVYGNGYKHIDDKFDILSKYKYAIVVENGSYPNYWTEKLADCMLAGCYPIYYGAPNINDFFLDGITSININDFENTVEIINGIIRNSCYNKNIEKIKENQRIVLEKYNLFNLIGKAIELSNCVEIDEFSYKIINPINFSLIDKIKQKITWKTGIIFNY